MAGHSSPRIAVIGAGMAGLSCAQALSARGLRPVVFDKGRGPGGRLATRRMDNGPVFDHGAQYVTAHNAPFRDLLQRLMTEGKAARWRPSVASCHDPEGEDWITGAPGMSGLAGALAAGLDLRRGTEILAATRSRRGWQLHPAAGGADEIFDVVVCTIPAPQAQRLFGADAALAAMLERVVMEPCWALLAAFAGPLADLPDVVEPGHPVFSRLCRNSSKPQRPQGSECWVAHAAPEWSAVNLELDRHAAMLLLVDALRRMSGGRIPAPEHAVAHRWRYARVTVPLGAPFLAQPDGSLWLGGDWTLGPRVECAFDSGIAIAQAIG